MAKQKKENKKKGESKKMEAGRYINPYTDYGFKHLFGSEPNKELTLALVNALLQSKEVINARRMKTKGYAIEDIAEITGLTDEELQQL